VALVPGDGKPRCTKPQKGAPTFYDVLAIPRTADVKDVRRAYRRKALAAHPDKGGTADAMRAVQEAFDVLSDPLLRADYDANLHMSSAAHAHPPDCDEMAVDTEMEELLWQKSCNAARTFMDNARSGLDVKTLDLTLSELVALLYLLKGRSLRLSGTRDETQPDVKERSPARSAGLSFGSERVTITRRIGQNNYEVSFADDNMEVTSQKTCYLADALDFEIALGALRSALRQGYPMDDAVKEALALAPSMRLYFRTRHLFLWTPMTENLQLALKFRDTFHDLKKAIEAKGIGFRRQSVLPDCLKKRVRETRDAAILEITTERAAWLECQRVLLQTVEHDLPIRAVSMEMPHPDQRPQRAEIRRRLTKKTSCFLPMQPRLMWTRGQGRHTALPPHLLTWSRNEGSTTSGSTAGRAARNKHEEQSLKRRRAQPPKMQPSIQDMLVANTTLVALRAPHEPPLPRKWRSESMRAVVDAAREEARELREAPPRRLRRGRPPPKAPSAQDLRSRGAKAMVEQHTTQQRRLRSDTAVVASGADPTAADGRPAKRPRTGGAMVPVIDVREGENVAPALPTPTPQKRPKIVGAATPGSASGEKVREGDDAETSVLTGWFTNMPVEVVSKPSRFLDLVDLCGTRTCSVGMKAIGDGALRSWCRDLSFRPQHVRDMAVCSSRGRPMRRRPEELWSHFFRLLQKFSFASAVERLDLSEAPRVALNDKRFLALLKTLKSLRHVILPVTGWDASSAKTAFMRMIPEHVTREFKD